MMMMFHYSVPGERGKETRQKGRKRRETRLGEREEG